MNVTESGFKNRQFHMEDYLQIRLLAFYENQDTMKGDFYYRGLPSEFRTILGERKI